MEKYFYQTSEYKPVEMTKKQLVEHVTAVQDECYDEEVAKMTYKIASIRKKDFAFHLKGAMREKTVFVFDKCGTDICGSFWTSSPRSAAETVVKVVVAIKSASGKYQVWDFDWKKSYYRKDF